MSRPTSGEAKVAIGAFVAVLTAVMVFFAERSARNTGVVSGKMDVVQPMVESQGDKLDAVTSTLGDLGRDLEELGEDQQEMLAKVEIRLQALEDWRNSPDVVGREEYQETIEAIDKLRADFDAFVRGHVPPKDPPDSP